jgi:hypothetical protein
MVYAYRRVGLFLLILEPQSVQLLRSKANLDIETNMELSILNHNTVNTKAVTGQKENDCSKVSVNISASEIRGCSSSDNGGVGEAISNREQKDSANVENDLNSDEENSVPKMSIARISIILSSIWVFAIPNSSAY